MCGIFFTCSRAGHVNPDNVTRDALVARGPDSLKLHHVQATVPSSEVQAATTTTNNRTYFLTFASSVLSLRGDHVYVQPLIDPETESVFCWNGEAWKIDGVPIDGNDTKQVFRLLLDAMKDARSARDEDGFDKYPDVVAKVLTRVAGPYAFVFYDATQSTVYYGRDRLGRRSLVTTKSNDSATALSLASFSLQNEPAIEVTTDGVHCLDLKTFPLNPRTIPWPAPSPLINKTVPDNDHAIQSIPSSETVVELQQHLTGAIRLRVLGVPTYTANTDESCTNPSRVAVLFSGGLDCTILARLAHENLPLDQPIDLLNVAFENLRTIRAAAQGKKNATNLTSPPSPYETCPDRITARSSFNELITTCPNRTWRLVAIDVPYSETLAHRSKVIQLMSPHKTEMDLSITLALYFASRGQGYAVTSASTSPLPYTTTSRVLLSGLGADELFGGYARHGAAFNRDSFVALNSELELDFTRIGSRNLGRDDRVMAHWGREIRYPYLDEDFVRFTLALPVWEKVGFREGKAVPKHFEGVGSGGSNEGNFNEDSEGAGVVMTTRKEDLDPAKMALRLMAWDLGMKHVAGEKKRAIQFGARTAKMEGGRTKGTDVLGPH